MEIIETILAGVLIIKNFSAEDDRGKFVKTYNKDMFAEAGICTDFKESYFSVSKMGVIRGMHFQTPPADHEKLVYVVKGQIIDVVLDIRRNSGTYGKTLSVVINDKNKYSMYIPRGCAHGFKSLDDGTITVYNVSNVYDRDYDTGIRWDSFNFDWGIPDPIISDRDRNLISFNDFELNNPFKKVF